MWYWKKIWWLWKRPLKVVDALTRFQSFFEKKRDYNKMTLEAKKEKNKLANLSIEEEKSLRV
jgi:hypothetical protein